jgi:hypothetical protein
MKAVAMMTPDPKYLAMKKANGGTRIFFDWAAIIGSNAPVFHISRWTQKVVSSMADSDIPSMEPNPITKIEDIRTPSLPL